MDGFERFLSETADVPPRRIPHYLRWVRRAYEMADGSLHAPLPPEDVKRVTRHLQQTHPRAMLTTAGGGVWSKKPAIR